MLVRAALFDLDGTLIDSDETVVWCTNELLRRLGKPLISGDKIKILIGVGLIPLLGNFIDHPEEYVDEYLKIYSTGFHSRTKVFPGAKELLSGLQQKGIKTAIVTNRHEGLARKIIDHFSLSEFLDLLKGKVEGIKLKPDPDIVFRACKEMNIDPSQMVMIGDTEIDVQTGKNAGGYSIKVEHKRKEDSTNADLRVDSLIEVLQMIRKD